MTPPGAPDYYKSILLYGLYNGAPVPLACDKQGRLILVTEPVSPTDKSGTILLQDTFDCGLIRVLTGTEGTLAAVALDDTEAAVGSFSCKLTGGSDGLGVAFIRYYHLVNAFNKLGVEFAARWGNFVKKLWIKAKYYTGTYRYEANLWHVRATDNWQIYDKATTSWVTILSGQGYLVTSRLYYPFKLVLDLENERYHRFKHPAGEVDLSAYTLTKAADTTSPLAEIYFWLESNAGFNGFVNLDNIIFTQDES